MRPDMPRRQIFNGTLGALFGFCLLILLVALQSSCSTAATRPSSESFRVEIIDNLDERRFDVSVTSLDDHAICISKENWPDESGGFAGPQDYTHLRVGSGTLPVSTAFSSIYCPGGCGEHRIAPQGVLRGFIAYGGFADANAIAAEPRKELHFSVTPYYCR